MSIMAFGTGIAIALGNFNAGWQGVWLEPVPRPWRSQALAAARPAWGTVPVTKTVWED